MVTHHGKPEMVHTDQGCQFTAQEFVQTVNYQGCQLSRRLVLGQFFLQ
jgi:transposase InsO family protein